MSQKPLVVSRALTGSGSPPTLNAMTNGASPFAGGRALVSDDRQFAILPVRALRDPALTAGDKLTLAALGAYTNRDGWCWPSVSTLAADCGMHERNVQRALRRLTDAGYLLVESRDGRSSRYHVQYDTALRQGGGKMSPVAPTPPGGGASATQNVNKNVNKNPSPQPSRNETELRVALAADPDALDALDGLLAATRDRTTLAAVIRRLAPGGTAESPGVTWPVVATGLLDARGGAPPFTGAWVTACIQRAAARASTPPPRRGARASFLDRLPEAV